jgi:hypothetical protein
MTNLQRLFAQHGQRDNSRGAEAPLLHRIRVGVSDLPGERDRGSSDRAFDAEELVELGRELGDVAP